MFNEWTLELKAMADRIISMRQQLFDALKSRGTLFLAIALSLFFYRIWLNVVCNVTYHFFLTISFMILYCNYATLGANVFLLSWINVAASRQAM